MKVCGQDKTLKCMRKSHENFFVDYTHGHGWQASIDFSSTCMPQNVYSHGYQYWSHLKGFVGIDTTTTQHENVMAIDLRPKFCFLLPYPFSAFFASRHLAFFQTFRSPRDMSQPFTKTSETSEWRKRSRQNVWPHFFVCTNTASSNVFQDDWNWWPFSRQTNANLAPEHHLFPFPDALSTRELNMGPSKTKDKRCHNGMHGLSDTQRLIVLSHDWDFICTFDRHVWRMPSPFAAVKISKSTEQWTCNGRKFHAASRDVQFWTTFTIWSSVLSNQNVCHQLGCTVRLVPDTLAALTSVFHMQRLSILVSIFQSCSLRCHNHGSSSQSAPTGQIFLQSGKKTKKTFFHSDWLIRLGFVKKKTVRCGKFCVGTQTCGKAPRYASYTN